MRRRLGGAWRAARKSRRVRLALVVYALLLLLSHLWTDVFTSPPAPDPGVVRVPIASPEEMTIGVRGWVPVVEREGDLRRVRGVRPWTIDDPTDGPPPLLLLHGSPSGGSKDLGRLGPLLARVSGRTVLAMDRPGYAASSKWVEDYSIRANALAANALLRELGYERAHAVGWSLGGGAAILMGALDPDLIGSVTLIGSIGVQEGEGSGDYYFEHAKYALGYVGLVVLPEVLPHFGLLGPRSLRHAFIRDFWDTDQRPIRGVLESYPTPLLVVHGVHDPLVPAWTAREHKRITPGASLLMLDASHFFVFMGGEGAAASRAIASDAIASFVGRHDRAGVAPIPRTTDLAPSTGSDDRTIAGLDFKRSTHWALVVLIIALATLVTEDLTVIACALLVSTQQLDIGVAIVGCFLGILGGDWGLVLIGRVFGRRVLQWKYFRKHIPERSLMRWEKMFDRHLAKAVFVSRMLPGTRLPMYVSAGILSRRLVEFMLWMTVAIAIWVPALLVLGLLIGRPLYDWFSEVFHGPVAIALAFFVLFLLIRLASYEATYSGRHKLNADLRRLVSHEFWPPVVFYLPLLPVLAWLSITRRGPMTFTCADPGIQPAGGVVNEPKTDIVHALEESAQRMGRPELVLQARRIPALKDETERTKRALVLIEGDALGGLPVVLKPEAAQRGFGVRIAHTPKDVHAYLERMTTDVQAQRYHAGPVEAGVFWSRVPTPGKPVDEWPGELFAVTRKRFPILLGDGEHTIEHLIWEHPRYRMQAGVFLRRFEDRLDEVLEKDEPLHLTRAGNHAQGTVFEDGADLITPELTRTLDELVQGYRHAETGARIDIGRFDVRASDEDELMAGRCAVIELNGVLSEATNMYDPSRSLFWAYRILFRQWTRLYDIGVARRREGVRATGAWTLLRLARAHYASRPGGVLSD